MGLNTLNTSSPDFRLAAAAAAAHRNLIWVGKGGVGGKLMRVITQTHKMPGLPAPDHGQHHGQHKAGPTMRMMCMPPKHACIRALLPCCRFRFTIFLPTACCRFAFTAIRSRNVTIQYKPGLVQGGTGEGKRRTAASARVQMTMFGRGRLDLSVLCLSCLHQYHVALLFEVGTGVGTGVAGGLQAPSVCPCLVQLWL